MLLAIPILGICDFVVIVTVLILSKEDRKRHPLYSLGMMHKLICPLALFLFACGSQSEKELPPVAVVKQHTPAVQKVEKVEDAGRTDLNKVGHGFPATLVMPDGMEIKVGWEEKRDSDGVGYGLSQASVPVNAERKLLINVVDGERAEQILGYRQDKRFKVRLDKDGADGAWAHVHEWSGESCSFSAFIPKGQISCVASFTPCDAIEDLAALCLSIKHTGKAPVEKRQPDYGFGHGMEGEFEIGPAESEAIFQLITAITENQPDKLLEMWSERGVLLYGKKVTAAKAASALKKRNTAQYLRVECVEEGIADRDYRCMWDASRSEEGVFVFQNIGSQQFGFVLKRDAEGQWKLATVQEF